MESLADGDVVRRVDKLVKEQPWCKDDRGLLYVRKPERAYRLAPVLAAALDTQVHVLVGEQNAHEKADTLRRWIAEGRWLVSTSAGGAGIDCKHIRAVVQADPADGLIDSIQKEGRAGRDRQPALALTLITPTTVGDVRRICEGLENRGPLPGEAAVDKELKLVGRRQQLIYLEQGIGVGGKTCLRMIRSAYNDGSPGLGCLGATEVRAPCSVCRRVLAGHGLTIALLPPETVSGLP